MKLFKELFFAVWASAGVWLAGIIVLNGMKFIGFIETDLDIPVFLWTCGVFNLFMLCMIFGPLFVKAKYDIDMRERELKLLELNAAEKIILSDAKTKRS